MQRIFILCLLLVCRISAAEITWGVPQSITGTLSDFDTVGTPVYQWNAGNNSVTIDPSGMNLTFVQGALFNGSVFNGVDPHNRGGDGNYEALLSTMSHTSSNASLNLTGLTVGHQYRLQLWMADTRSCCQGRKKTYDSGPATTAVILDSGPPSQYVIGTFIADATTQTLRFRGSGAAHPQYNALALRTLGPPTPVVEQFEVSNGVLASDAAINVAPSTSVTLTWDIDNADSVSIDQSIGTVSSAGNTTVSPSATTTYTLTATNTHGTSQHSITVYVNATENPLQINELIANNSNGLRDEDGDASDWIELYNPNPFVIDGGSYRLTDNPSLATTWQLPFGTAIPANGYLVVFASSKNRTGAELHTDFKLDADGDYLAVTNAAGDTVLYQIPSDYPTTALYPNIPKNKSYGLGLTSGQLRFFDSPTPGEENGDGFLGFVKDTTFSHDRGFYDTSFNLTISSATTGATIRYTTDGSPPSETHGTIYTAPIAISQTTVIRAMAYQTGYAPTNIDTHTYVFASDVIASSVMDTGITQHGTYGPQMIDSLKALPIISINIEDPNSVTNDNERPTSVEMIFPDGSDGFQVDAGVSYFGGYFTNFDKKSFRLYFRKQYGPGKLN
ncbi:MAG: FN3 associated domain-containing protein, partial [Akkermansiaceae bacterium]